MREAVKLARLTKIHNDLLLVDILTLLLLAVIVLFPTSVLRILLGVPFALFFPGYALIAALFPRKSDLGGVERLALSLGLSVAVVPLIGLALNFTSWGIRLYPILISVSALTIITSLIAWYRRLRLPDTETISLSLKPALAFGKDYWKAQKSADKVRAVILAVVVLAALGTIGYSITKPRVEEKFTEFYIGGDLSKAGTVPGQLSPGTAADLTLGIINHERAEAEYRIEVREPGVLLTEVGPVTLQHEEKWEQSVEFTPATAGENQRIEFLLFKGESEGVYRKLHIFVNVR